MNIHSKNNRWFLTAALSVLFLLPGQFLTAADSNDFRKSIGLTAGFYSPSFDFFDQSLWSFSHTSAFGAEFDYHFNRYFFVKTGVDFHSSEAEVLRPEFDWSESILFEFIPIHLSLLGKYQLEHFSVFGGPGLEFVSISGTYNSPNESQFKSGYTTLYSINAGAQKEFGNFAVSLQSKYLIGEFRQRMEVGTDLSRNNEISLNGLKISVVVKYLF